MNEKDLKDGTKQFSLRVIRLVGSLPSTPAARTIGNQLLRSATSVGANYRSACRAKSKPDFIAKAGIVVEEADESLYWMELLEESKAVPTAKIADLMKEASELVAIFTASIKTARTHTSS